MHDNGVKKFHECIEQVRESEARLGLLIGNGFSMAWDASRPESPPTFDYRSLWTRAGMDEWVARIPEPVALPDTCDFEVVIDHITRTADELRVRAQKEPAEDLARRAEALTEHAEKIKVVLASTLAANHPASALELTARNIHSARAFLSNFDAVFTLNYDLLLYWATLACESAAVPKSDGFVWPSVERGEVLVWNPDYARGRQAVHYLHGALHLFRTDAGGTRKLQYRPGVPLKDQILTNMNSGFHPLVVTEGSSEQKRLAIKASPYLTACHRELSSFSGALFLHGFAFSPNDAHLIELIEARDSGISTMCVSLYGDPLSKDNTEIRKRARLVADRRAENGGPELQIHFYDAESAQPWNSEVAMTSPILLDAYAAKQCPRRIHNDWDATIRVEAAPPSPEQRLLLERGRRFEDEIVALLTDSHGKDCRDLRDLSSAELVQATLNALSSGVPIIVGGRLPDSPALGAKGRPDLLLRVSAEGEPHKYVPGDIKSHKLTKATKTTKVQCSDLTSPLAVSEVVGRSLDKSAALNDMLQLAHYASMLDELGLSPDGNHLGAIISSDEYESEDGDVRRFLWLDLDAPIFTSCTHHGQSTSESAMDRYRCEIAFRLEVAQRARECTDRPGGPSPLVIPIGQAECNECPWHDYCVETVGPGVASWDITDGRLDVHEWLALKSRGVYTTAQLAQLDLTDADWVTDYAASVSHQSKAAERLRKVHDKAVMIEAGEQLRALTDPSTLFPVADVEIDLDIEWDVDGHVYLWGAYYRPAPDAEPQYIHFVSWDVRDEDSERILAEEFATWLRDVMAKTEAAGKSICVYHYHHVEQTHMNRILGEDSTADIRAVLLDMLKPVQENFASSRGFSIKHVAPALGFEWRDEDPGGLQSQVWLEEARNADRETAEALHLRILEYNEDDVKATAYVRGQLRLKK